MQSCRALETKVAVILVAGVGSRLRPLTDDRPKALVQVGEETIVQRAIRLLAAKGVQEVILATGYRPEALKRALGGAPLPVIYRHNPEYDRTQNSVSLALCGDAVEKRSFYKLDGDVIFEPAVLDRLDTAPDSLSVAVDTSATLDAEAMKVAVADGGRIRAFGKRIPPERAAGESIGIERIDASICEQLFDRLRAVLAAGRTDLYYEEVYNELILDGVSARAVPVPDLPWVEIDTLDDLRVAARRITEFAR